TGFTYGTGVDSEFKLGNNNDGSSTDLFWGILSDVKVYNYALTAQEVASEFLAVRTDLPWVCDREAYGQDSGLMELDVNNDCVINLEDFAAYAERWMDDRYQLRRPLP
ncbi:MAG: LamG domain-containing protein, partial [Phycisphaerae bacterium]|nr:LamG domain-containing protein [Phycisphaerae bacterium]